MLQFSEENIDWLTKLIDEGVTRTSDEVKVKKLNTLKEKIEKLGEYSLNVTITQQEVEETNKVIEELQEIVDFYSTNSDIGALEIYDDIKKRMTSKLQYLSTYKEIFVSEVSHLEDVLKKEIRITIVQDIKDTEGVSFTQADKLVEKDKRYTTLRDQVYYVKKVTTRIKSKYDFFMQSWQMIFQSCSTASKEKYSAKYNNDS